jgi:molybdopterin-guanine dinucleotide biosynthesis protein A
MLTIAILAGGQSHRMGKDKANMLFHGKELFKWIVDRLAGLHGETIIIGSVNQEFINPGIRVLVDIYPNYGPLGGLYTALVLATTPLVACIACDMPFANPKLIAYQQDILLSEKMDVVVPSTKIGIEPLHGIYRRETCQPAAREALQKGEKRLISWFPKVKAKILDPDVTKGFDHNGLTFLNINSPEEFDLATEIEEEYYI